MDELAVRAVERVIEDMRGRLAQSITIDDMARVARFSKFHFSRVFHRHTGLPPARFLSCLRLAEARRLLATTTLNITDISARVGYHSPTTFSARFKTHVGMSPTQYRKSAKGSPHG
ncbi:transcriptional regulator GlxA family with amidase domain [Actinokineospora baliensis]|uniref:helix-turn-helix domain-containing protein n=1 Tax=Actinokineospora baliensis TaxID=547056 RepID=UPI00195DF3B1|nr:AraC family transcriptional regulator [Actinokineospora baliensis]MBM7774201.1 transcriptional regulator GlxA family with amidase domain [Actinokineospora baliensis]